MHITNENLDCCILTLFIHNVCNFKCSYCNDYHRDGSNRWPEDWKPYLNLIEKIKENNKYVYVEILGGEPTLWPRFQEFIEYISGENVFIEYATNASRTLSYWNKFKTQNTFVFLSWHHEFMDDDHFIRVAEIMQHKASVSIPLMIVPDNFERAKKIYGRLTKLNVEVTPKFTRTSINGFQYFDYTEEQKNWIKNNSYNKMKPFSINWKIPQTLHFDGQPIKFMNVLDNQLHKFKNYTCTAGIKRLTVDPNGDIKRCTKKVGGIIGNIFDSFQLPKDPITCSYEACPCKLDAIVEKWKI